MVFIFITSRDYKTDIRMTPQLFSEKGKNGKGVKNVLKKDAIIPKGLVLENLQQNTLGK